MLIDALYAGRQSQFIDDAGQVRGRPHRRDQRRPADPRREGPRAAGRRGLTPAPRQPPATSRGNPSPDTTRMTERTLQSRIILHEDIGAMEAISPG